MDPRHMPELIRRRARVATPDGWFLPIMRHGAGWVALVHDRDLAVQLLDNIEISALRADEVLGTVDPLDLTGTVGATEAHRLEALAVCGALRCRLTIGYAKPRCDPEPRKLNPISWTEGNRFCALDLGRQQPRTFRTDRVRWVEAGDDRWAPRWVDTGGYHLAKRPHTDRVARH